MGVIRLNATSMHGRCVRLWRGQQYLYSSRLAPQAAKLALLVIQSRRASLRCRIERLIHVGSSSGECRSRQTQKKSAASLSFVAVPCSGLGVRIWVSVSLGVEERRDDYLRDASALLGATLVRPFNNVTRPPRSRFRRNG